MESLDDVLGYEGLKIYQNTDFFSFSLDSVMLANFVSLRAKTSEIMDLGCGNAVIPLILSKRCLAHIDGVEIQNPVFELAQKTVEYNKLSKRINIINDNMKNLVTSDYIEKYDVVTCNPPYFPVASGSYLNEKREKLIARHEVEITISEVVETAAKLLKNKGRFALVCRSERFLEIMNLLQKNSIEPKRLRYVFSKEGKNAVLFLVEGIKGGNPGLTIEYPLIMCNSTGNVLDEYAEMLVEVKK